MKGWHAPKFTKEDVRGKLTKQDIKDILGLLTSVDLVESLNDYVEVASKAQEKNNKNGRQI